LLPEFAVRLEQKTGQVIDPPFRPSNHFRSMIAGGGPLDVLDIRDQASGIVMRHRRIVAPLADAVRLAAMPQKMLLRNMRQ
jgi:hypothetical protein